MIDPPLWVTWSALIHQMRIGAMNMTPLLIFLKADLKGNAPISEEN